MRQKWILDVNLSVLTPFYIFSLVYFQQKTSAHSCMILAIFTNHNIFCYFHNCPYIYLISIFPGIQEGGTFTSVQLGVPAISASVKLVCEIHKEKFYNQFYNVVFRATCEIQQKGMNVASLGEATSCLFLLR